VFHIQLRQFPNVSREFNLEQAELETRILRPWLAGEMVRSGERRWAPERAKLTIYEGPRLGPEDIGMGRGWPNVTRTSVDVTAQLLSVVVRRPSAPTEAAAVPSASGDELERCKQLILARAANGSFEIRECVRLAEAVRLGARASERLALAEQAVWELLHTGGVELAGEDGSALDRGAWQEALLDWETWGGERQVFVRAV
jgi:Arc/MetJ family transcription regulator